MYSPDTLDNDIVAVTGSEGQLGKELCKQLGARSVPLTRNQLELCNAESVRKCLRLFKPKVLINCAAWTNVELAESRQRDCYLVNATGVGFLAEMCNQLDALLVQISTDYVFGAEFKRARPYSEDETPAPVNVYGASKLLGEIEAKKSRKHLIVRTCGLYSVGIHGPVRGRNFADSVQVLARDQRALRIVNDQYCTPSFVPHVANGILRLISAEKTGVYHLTNTGYCSWYDFASELFRLTSQSRVVDVEVIPISSSQYSSKVTRPSFSVLNCERALRNGGILLPNWQEGIRQYLAFQNPKMEACCSPTSSELERFAEIAD